MKFLEKYNFNKEDIKEFLCITPKKLIDLIESEKDLVEVNLKYFTSLGINTYREIFINYPDMFLMDASDFKNVFDKYDKDSLIAKLNKNFKIVEYL